MWSPECANPERSDWPLGPLSRSSRFALLAAVCVVAAACGSNHATVTADAFADAPLVAANSTTKAFVARGECTGGFIASDLDHLTTTPGDTASTFDGTGSGVAVGDLDEDGDLDIVLANLSGSTSLLRNDSDLRFTPEALVVGRFRQVAIVDVDGDTHLDIVLSSGVGPPYYLRNTGDDVGGDVASRFERGELPGVRAATYSMAWGDLGGDGDLDLVTGSYNAELTQLRNTPVVGSDTGVVLHEFEGSEFVATRLAAEAQALAVRLVDLNGDFQTDILVGNDLATPDAAWVDNDGGWLPVEPFTQTSFSTMSLDAGDIDNDGDLDVFSTDMRPRSDDVEADLRYVEVNDDMAAMGNPDEIQKPENILSLAGGGGFEPVDTEAAATGWSWSGLFGDLDSDGYLDLYVVTGMKSKNLFGALKDNELVEPNQAFVNREGESFERAPEWGLNDEAGGRGMVEADLDNDGDLDIVVNNLDTPSRVFENQICGGSNLIVDLKWTDSLNTAAIGATIRVTSGDRTYTRTIDAARGYLSGGPLSAHVGLGSDSGPVFVTVLWPDGSRSDISDVAVNSHLTITR